jgi:hypothetical protein
MILASNKQHKEKLGGRNKIDIHKRKTKHREPAQRKNRPNKSTTMVVSLVYFAHNSHTKHKCEKNVKHNTLTPHHC